MTIPLFQIFHIHLTFTFSPPCSPFKSLSPHTVANANANANADVIAAAAAAADATINTTTNDDENDNLSIITTEELCLPNNHNYSLNYQCHEIKYGCSWIKLFQPPRPKAPHFMLIVLPQQPSGCQPSPSPVLAPAPCRAITKWNEQYDAYNFLIFTGLTIC